MSVTFQTTIIGWRIADGLLKRGRGREGEETLEMIDGRLLRVGVYEGVGEDGTAYKQVECDLDTEDGIQYVKAAIGLNPQASNLTPFMFVQGLLAVDKGDWIAIAPERSKTPHEKYGTYSTFVNVGLVDPATQKARAVKIDKGEFPGDNSKEKLPHALKRLEGHSAFAERPNRDDDEAQAPEAPPFELGAPNEGLVNFKTVLADKGWPGFDLAEAEYLVLAQKVGKVQYADGDAVPSEVWDALAKSAKSAKEMPASIKKLVESLGAYDPFADE